MVKVTVAFGSSRPGGLDVSLCGLLNQTFQDFEVVFADARYYERHEKVLDYVKSCGLRQPFYHVPNHRFNKRYHTSCAGINTSFMLSEGEIIIMLMDYAYAFPDWIENHLKHHDKKRLVMSPYIYYDPPEVVTKNGQKPTIFKIGIKSITVDDVLNQRENFDEISIFKTPFKPSLLSQLHQPGDQDAKVNLPEGPSTHDYMHTKNESFLREDVLSIGGMDEHYDRGGGPGDLLFGWSFEQIGCVPWICQEAKVHVVDPRWILPKLHVVDKNRSQYGGRETISYPTGWYYNEGESYYYERMRSGDPVSKNPYDMREKRKELWPWRELSQERKTVIPRNDVPDEAYFKEEIKPR